MRWFYVDSGRQIGPVEEASLDDLVRQGVVRDDTLVWREGMAGWQPHGQARGRVSTLAAPYSAQAASAAAAYPAVTRYCSECGRPFPENELTAVGTASVCGGCRPLVMQRMAAMPPAAAPPGAVAPGVPAMVQTGAGFRYAGFWIRFLARIIDGIILGIVAFIIRLPFTILLGISGAGLRTSNDPAAALAALPILLGAIGLTLVIDIVVGVLYEVYFVSTRGATPGKMALGLKIVRSDGGPVSAGLAAGRYFSMWISGFILMIGYIMAGFDAQKRALHDHICNTRVVHVR